MISQRYVIPGETEYMLCGVEGCPLFVEENYIPEGMEDEIAPYVHLCNTDYHEDSFYEDDHEAQPGETQTLSYWQASGPLPVRARFGRPDPA